jgi:hypothetical protein
MNKGVVYLVYDRPDILEYQEISKSKVKEAGYDVCLISNFSIDRRKFKYDHYQEVDLPFGNNKNIAFLLDHTPFDISLYIDADVHLYGNPEFAFKKCDIHEVCLTHSPMYDLHYRSTIKVELKKEVDKKSDLIEYQAGWILFKKSISAEKLFDEYKRIAFAHPEVTYSQQIFSLAVEHSGINPFILPSNWNYRAFHQHLHGELKFWHNYFLPPAKKIAKNDLPPRPIEPIYPLKWIIQKKFERITGIIRRRFL